MRQINNWIAKVVFLMVIMTSVAYGDDIKFKKITLSPGDKTWLLNAEINLELSPALEQLVKKGVTLHFVTEFQLTKGRWYWFDEKIVDVQRTSKISYQALTDQYRVTLGSVTLTAANLKQAMAAVSTIDDWAVVDQSAVNQNQSYIAAIRMRLDTNQLAKPFQVNAINSKAWNLQSEWSRFEFTPKAVPLTHGVNAQ
ncbi:DUF4390 domain-containing protein [Polynucleobacter sp. MWH-Spelu-300-X4]|jgi:hypothetical protein|uniref:DUF4390 domain-containing protein n=1 Tax=Polynucleobacter sp. MWH-Spelu-300-X4 TaxID=2689109 RepID=UPI001BFD8FF6|nr:DUF4390 domain-containing protein [Polynucleobacter sp. MWH-Spelu-300-X4]QWD79746.1 DUF4390 domain-containing protein [Polynucleobacter sp. MWH-Spelu-300-X4]